jgi:hypothetical protein
MPRPHLHWIKFLFALVIAALLTSACGQSDGDDSPFTQLSAQNPVAQSPAGLAVSVNPSALTGAFGVQINAVPADASNEAAALPAQLKLRGSLFEIRTDGAAPDQVFLSTVIPAQSDPAHLDLYAWDGAAWTFLPSERRGGQIVSAVSTIPGMVGLFEAASPLPLAFTTLEPGQALTADASQAVNGALLGGVYVQSNGSLAGQLPATPPDHTYALYPVVRNYDAITVNTAVLDALLNDPVVRANHLQVLISFASVGYDGLALDYRGVSESLRLQYALFVNDLAIQLHTLNKDLFVIVEPAAPQAGASGAWERFATGGYDWQALGTSADALLIPVSNDPAAFGNGYADALLMWAVGQVNRSRLRLTTSALSVDASGGGFALRDYTSALAPLGSAQSAPEMTTAPYAGQPITVTLSGSAQALDYDAQAFAARYTYADDAGAAHTVWLTSADTLRQRLALAEKYRLGGVVVADLLQAGAPANLAKAITEYKVQMASVAAAQASLLWTVSDASGVLVQATAQPGEPYVYVPQNPGDYQIAAAFQYGSAHSLGAVPVSVASPPAQTIGGGTSGSVVGTSGGDSGGTSGGVSGGNTGGDSGGSTGFVPPPPVAGGPFELGAQVPGFIGHPGEMQQAGMKWVKFQVTGDASGLIAAGKGAGFKVLLSAVGDRSRAADPAYWPEYAAWVAGMAAQGADAIEVWNEANIDREWPTGQLSGVTYTELLKQAYAAIKAANPNTLVISGAPAPTGAEGAFPNSVMNDDHFLQQMAGAGAASYMDCVGIHYNNGTTSPNEITGSALSGYHYSYYFWPMIDLYYNAFGGSRPLCFTELGYPSPQGFEHIPLPVNFAWASGISVAEQAQWLAESASLSASSGKVRLMIVFNMDFTVYLSNDPQAAYAIIRPDGSCPACSALDAVMP